MHDAIFACITGRVGGSVNIVRISGEYHQIKRVLAVICPNLAEVEVLPRKQILSNIFDAEGSLLDSGLVTYFKAPNSFTGQDVLEIALHAGQFVLEGLFASLSSINGCRYAKEGEFSYRGFVNHKFDLTYAEGIDGMVKATTKLQHKYAINSINGVVQGTYLGLKEALLNLMGYTECLVDFAEDEDIDFDFVAKIKYDFELVRNRIRDLILSHDVWAKVDQGFKIAIFGEPNAGKSSLINRLAKDEVAIVSEIAGTTRDVVSARLRIAGLPVSVYDTAGIRDEGSDTIEAEGIKKARKKVMESDVAILVIDPKNYTDTLKLLEGVDVEKLIVAINKCDVVSRSVIDDFRIKFEGFKIVEISAKSGDGIAGLMREVEVFISKDIGSKSGNEIAVNTRHVGLLKAGLEALNGAAEICKDSTVFLANIELFAENVRFCASRIDEITGVIDPDKVLDVVFGNFCIGK